MRPTVRIDILTLFPKITEGALGESMMKRAQDKSLVEIHSHNIRDWARDKHLITDDAPYGGGQGMVMKPEPIFEAVEALLLESGKRESEVEDQRAEVETQEAGINPKSKIVLMSPAGRPLNHRIASEYAKEDHVIIICGHYEGVDQRVVDQLVDDEISIGDYVLTNGAIAAIVFVDAFVRLIPGVLGDEGSAADDSFARGLLEFPQYTRPVEYRGLRVPDILLSGHHAEIAKWRAEKSLEKTKKNRPDLLGP
jgi:tRNA (guanine37-N1)-methyltransferase